MTAKDTRKVWMTLIVVGICCVLWEVIPLKDASARLERLPQTGILYESKDLPVTGAEKTIFGKATLLKRLYSTGKDQFVMIAIDGTHNRHGVHDPLYCFRGEGYELIQDADIPFKGGKYRSMILEKKGQKISAAYWYSDGHSRYSSPTKYWWETALRRLTFGLSGPEPVLVILQSIDARPLDWTIILDRIPPLADL